MEAVRQWSSVAAGTPLGVDRPDLETPFLLDQADRCLDVWQQERRDSALQGDLAVIDTKIQTYAPTEPDSVTVSEE